MYAINIGIGVKCGTRPPCKLSEDIFEGRLLVIDSGKGCWDYYCQLWNIAAGGVYICGDTLKLRKWKWLWLVNVLHSNGGGESLNSIKVKGNVCILDVFTYNYTDF